MDEICFICQKPIEGRRCGDGKIRKGTQEVGKYYSSTGEKGYAHSYCIEMEELKAGRYEGYEIEDLEKVFAELRNPDDWKAPIFASMPGEMVNIAVAAIKFYTETVPTVSLDVKTMTYYVQSEGYRLGPAGDH
ncbi:MAG: hypothetical protein ONB55_21795 [candidate division KSB1 bacterium]|nr:hypothetical protein [candidate division KSB1 bacterium]